jgi:UDP-GlcNAc3NAcA epimerase
MPIPVASIEAGLRSFNGRMPEEINRILTDHCSALLFSPTKTAMNNLIKEGIPSRNIQLVGDVMYDTAVFYAKKAEEKSNILEVLTVKNINYILVTIHRAENTDGLERLNAIVSGLLLVAQKITVVFPLNPRTREALYKYHLTEKLMKNVHVTGPLGYFDMIKLEKYAAIIVTDSGGVQKEAYFNGVPCVTLREETEWVELVETGWNHLCPPVSGEKVNKCILDNIGNQGIETCLYGDGRTAEKIVSHFL